MTGRVIGSSWHTPLSPSSKLVIFLYSALVPAYLWFLIDQFLTFEPFIACFIFVLSEAFLSSTPLLIAAMCWRTGTRVLPPAPEGRSVDVFITTYNESLECLEETIRNCVALDYPHETYVLDDGRRSEVRRLSYRLGAKYITRENRTHFKAGNLNNALKHTRGEFIALFDADGIPRKDFLSQLLGYFQDEKVAIVQSAQMLYNFDSFQHSPRLSTDGLWHEQSLFIDVLQPGRDQLGIAQWSGSGSLLRRSALEEVGGVAPETVTEDYHTSLKLQMKGYEVRYHPETLCYNLAPRNRTDFINQRSRWCLGLFQAVRLEWRNLLSSRCSWWVRLSVLDTLSYYSVAVFRLLALVSPLLLCMHGGSSVDGTTMGVGLIVLFWLLRGQIVRIVTRGRGTNTLLGGYWFFKMWVFMKNLVATIFNRPWEFQVTNKEATDEPSLSLDTTLATLYCATLMFGGGFLLLSEGNVPATMLVFAASGYQLRLLLHACFLEVRGVWVWNAYAFALNLGIEYPSELGVETGISRLFSRRGLTFLATLPPRRGDTIQVSLKFGDTRVQGALLVESVLDIAVAQGFQLAEVQGVWLDFPKEEFQKVMDRVWAVGPDRFLRLDPASLGFGGLAIPSEVSEPSLRLNPSLASGFSVVTVTS